MASRDLHGIVSSRMRPNGRGDESLPSRTVTTAHRSTSRQAAANREMTNRHPRRNGIKFFMQPLELQKNTGASLAAGRPWF
jgi:hypothetical protein